MTRSTSFLASSTSRIPGPRSESSTSRSFVTSSYGGRGRDQLHPELCFSGVFHVVGREHPTARTIRLRDFFTSVVRVHPSGSCRRDRPNVPAPRRNLSSQKNDSVPAISKSLTLWVVVEPLINN